MRIAELDSVRRILLSVLAALITCQSQAFDVFWTGQGDGVSWTDGNNWDTLAPPDEFFEDVPIINTGATVMISTAVTDAAGLVLGQEVGDSGTLVIQNGGSLTLIDKPGAATLVPPDGQANISLAGDALLEVHGGGSFITELLDINQNGTVRIGTTGTNASIESAGGLFSDGVIEVQGPGHTFTVAGNATLEGQSRYTPRLTGLTHSAMVVAGNASLGGMLRPETLGFTPSVGQSFDLIDAAAINGSFGAFDDSQLPMLGNGQAYRTRTVAGGNGEVLQLVVEQFLTAVADWDDNTLTISNQGTESVTITGYSILSASGGLDPSEFTMSFDDRDLGGAGVWEEATPTANALNELSPLGSLTINGGESYTIGNAFAPNVSSPFGVSPEDLVFEYSTTNQETLEGIVEYLGDRDTNDFRLTVDPLTGEAQIKNDSGVAIDLVGYTVLSTSGSLLTAWDSLDDQEVDGAGLWEEALSSATALSELNPTAATTIGPDEGYGIGDLWNTTTGLQDLQFMYALDGETTFRVGTVIFGELPGLGGTPLPGDANGDGKVDILDLDILSGNFGTSGGATVATGDFNGDGNVDILDLDILSGNFGAMQMSSASIPEPFAGALLMTGVAAGAAWRRPKMA